MDTLAVAHTIIDSLEQKKGEDILLMDIQNVAIFAEYFVIATGTSERMLNALADGAVQAVKQAHNIKGRIEGSPRDGWLLVDWGDIILHLFSPDRRDYYSLEDLWNEAKVLLHLQ